MRTSLEDYIKKYGEEEGTKKYNIGRSRAITLENMIKKYGEEEGTIKYNNYLQKIRDTRGFNYYKKKHPDCTLEEYKKLFNHTSKESFINRYGQDEGIKRYNEYIEKNSKSVKRSKEKYIETYGIDEYRRTHCNSKENLIKKYGNDIGNKKWEEYIKKLSIANSLNGYKNRYGDELGEIKWEEYKEKQRKSNKHNSVYFKYINSLKYYIDTYGEEIGNIKYNEYKLKQDRCSIKYFLNKYKDPDIAQEKYKISCAKHCAKMSRFYSLISQELFYNLHQYILLFDDNPDVQYATLNGEFSLLGDDGIKRFYDFRYKNIIIEYNGDYWHANPKYYKEDDLIKQIPAKEIWEKDLYKKMLAEKNNYTLLYVWDSSYQYNKDSIIQKILKLIK